MFSQMIAGLRKEAEKVSGSNYAMLVNSPNKDLLASEISGSAAKDKYQVAAGILAIGGVGSVFGLAAANVAAASVAAGVQVGAATLSLASASTVLAGLGTVAIGATVLPVAAVAAIGLLATSAVALVISKSMGVDWDKGITAQGLAQKDDREGLVKFGASQTGLSDWLKGAKNLVVNSLKDRFSGPSMSQSVELESNAREQKYADYLSGIASSISNDVFASNETKSLAQIEASKAQSAVGNFKQSLLHSNKALDHQLGSFAKDKNSNVFSDYEVSDLLDHDEGKQNLVDRIGDVALAKFGVVLDPIKTHEALSQSRGNESFSGKILAVNEKSGLVLMSSGRGSASVHNLRDFANVPEVGKNADISYKQGKMQTGKEQAKERDSGLMR